MLPGEIETLRSENADLREKLDSMQAQLMQAQKLGSIGVLASSITHEFNNILMTVINYSKMGLRHRDNDTREKAFNKILDAGQRAAKITTGMLSYARAKGDRRDPLSLVQVVQDVLVLVEKDLQKHRITLDTRFQDDPYAEVNSGQVQQVLLNLIINARQAMAEGHADHHCPYECSGRNGQVAVRDTGTGIPAAKLPHIFDPFFSTKKADEQGQGGTGLGLALCKDIIEAHKGRIRVESAEGQGTCFTLRFPLVEKPALLAG
ncbi:MAG: HAMP domain-containing sensor histidine kinase [Planctomycetaceae bacterium]